MPIIYIKGNCYETPLYGHVRSDKQDGDKGLGMRSEEPLRVGGGRGRGGEKGYGTGGHNHLWSGCSSDTSSDFYYPLDLDLSKLIFILISG